MVQNVGMTFPGLVMQRYCKTNALSQFVATKGCFEVQIKRGGGRGAVPLENHKQIWFLSNTGPDSLKNHKATKLAFNIWPSSIRLRNAIEKAFRWRADDFPFIVIFG